MQIAYAAVNHVQTQPRSARAHPAMIILGGDHKSILRPLGETATSGWACLVFFLGAFLLQLQLQGAWCHSKTPCWGCTQGCALFSFVFSPQGCCSHSGCQEEMWGFARLSCQTRKTERFPQHIDKNKKKNLLLCYPKYNNKLDRHCSHQKIQENAILLQENVTWKDVWYQMWYPSS